MKQNSMPVEFRNCPHCSKENTLQYYHEQGKEDLYFCNKCYGLVKWNGKKVIAVGGEAYPMRDKGKF